MHRYTTPRRRSAATSCAARVRGGCRDGAYLERARLAVGKGIKAALGHIAAAHPPLGQHLAATVRRGYVCVYTPDPRHPIAWEG